MILNEYSKTAWINGASPDINKANLDNLEQGVYNVTAKAMELAAYEVNAAASATAAATSATNAATSASNVNAIASNDATVTLMRMNGYNYPIGNAVAFTKVSDTKIKISQGVICMQGRYYIIPSAGIEITVPTCTAWKNRKDLVTLKYDNGAWSFVVTTGTETTGTALAPALVTETQYTGLTESVFSMNLAYITFANAVLTTISTIQRPIYIENGDKWQLIKTIPGTTTYISISSVLESGTDRLYPVPFTRFKFVIESNDASFTFALSQMFSVEDFKTDAKFERIGGYQSSSFYTNATIFKKLENGKLYTSLNSVVNNGTDATAKSFISVYGC